MVVFTCNHCGESLQKPRVEKHYNFTCRLEKFLTCVDCFKDFRGNEYNVHTKCVTEEQRYSGKDFVQKTKKGEVKQESWMEMIKSIIKRESNLSPSYKNLLNTISYYNNVPRKKLKFINFIKSSTGGRTNISDIEGIWNIIEKYKTQNSVSIPELDNQNITEKEKVENINSQENGHFVKSKNKKRMVQENTECTNDLDEVPYKKKKGFLTNTSGDIVDDVKNTFNETPKFSCSEYILQILTEKKSISKKKLCKKISKQYLKCIGKSISQEKLERKMNKKLKKISNLVVEENYVKLFEK